MSDIQIDPINVPGDSLFPVAPPSTPWTNNNPRFLPILNLAKIAPEFPYIYEHYCSIIDLKELTVNRKLTSFGKNEEEIYKLYLNHIFKYGIINTIYCPDTLSNRIDSICNGIRIKFHTEKGSYNIKNGELTTNIAFDYLNSIYQRTKKYLDNSTDLNKNNLEESFNKTILSYFTGLKNIFKQNIPNSLETEGTTSLNLFNMYLNNTNPNKTYTLKQLGLNRIWRQVYTNGYLNKPPTTSVLNDFKTQISNGSVYFKNAYPFGSHSNYIDAEWAIGGATLEGNFIPETLENSKVFGTIKINFHDIFEDPFSTYEKFGIHTEPGNKYNIIGDFERKVNIPITQEQYEKLKESYLKNKINVIIK